MRISTFFLSVLFLANSLSAQYQMKVFHAGSFRTGQAGTTADQCIDNNIETIYHSSWNETGIPDKLTFIFSDRVKSFNKIEYIPRQEGLNGVWTKLHIYYTTRSAPETLIKLTTTVLEWELDNETKVFDLPATVQDPHSVIFIINAAGGNHSSCAEMKFYSDEPLLPDGSVDCVINTDELISGQDQKINIITEGSFASTYQPGENIEKCFDNIISTLYHSEYGGGSAVFPVELNFQFSGSEAMDFVRYIPRADGGYNGTFGNVTISYNIGDSGPESVYQDILNYDFKQSNQPADVFFPMTITPRNIRFTVFDGGGNFVSCAEMEFYKNSAGTGTSLPYKDIFANDLYSELNDGISQEEIDTITSVFYQDLARCIFSGDHNKKYRVQQFLPYPELNTVAEDLKISTYDRFENMTGIFVEKNQRIAIFVGDLPNESIYLRVRDFHKEDEPTDDSYQLKKGLNVITVTHKGLAYINYFTDNVTAPPVDIHIVNGLINGYFDINFSTNEDWVKILNNTAYPKVDIRGKYVHLVYDKVPLGALNSDAGLAFIARYDSIVKYERVLMDLFKYDKSPVNRQFAWTESRGGWYAGGLGAHFDLTWGTANSCATTGLDLWGIAHEFGHVNQVRPGLKWLGTTEVTNNMYSLWVTYKMNLVGKKYTRLEEEELSSNGISPQLTGGRFNGFIEKTMIENQPLQAFTEDYHFKVLIPFWQLELYYQEAGACRNSLPLDLDEDPPVQGIDYAHWLGTVAETVRNTDESNLNDGELLLNFVKNTCDAVHEDLTDFFIKTGFLKAIDITIDDYGIGQLTITQTQIDDLINAIKAKNYPKPVSPVINYLSAHSVGIFKNQFPLEGINGEGVELIDTNEFRHLNIDHEIWKNSVAFETYDISDNLIHVAINSTGDLSGNKTIVQYPENALNVFAVGFDGVKILVYPKQIVGTNEVNNSYFNVYPNPASSDQTILIKLKDASENYQLRIIDSNGKIVMTGSGDLMQINSLINKRPEQLSSGGYIIQLVSGINNYMAKLIIK